MIVFLDFITWNERLSKVRSLIFSERKEFADVMLKSFKLKADYILYEVRGNVVISLLAFSSGNNIVVPLHFVYSSLWINKDISEEAYCTYLSDFLSQLKKCYNRISFNLDVGITDVRPFIWAGFSVKNRYTYIRNLNGSVKYPTDIKRSIRELKELGARVTQSAFSHELLKKNLFLYEELGAFSKGKRDKISHFFNELQGYNFLRFYVCVLDSQIITSGILFVDEHKKQAYTVFIDKLSKKTFGNHSVHAYLYDEIFKHFQLDGYALVDLLGANMLGISRFKSKLSVKLCHRFDVSYSKTDYLLARYWNFLKGSITNILRKHRN